MENASKLEEGKSKTLVINQANDKKKRAAKHSVDQLVSISECSEHSSSSELESNANVSKRVTQRSKNMKD